MAKKPPPALPPFRIHKGTGQAYVLLDGKRRYLGRADAPDAKQQYNQLVAEWLAAGRRLTPDVPDLSVVELTAAFMRYARDYYAPPSKEAEHFGIVVGMLNALYGDTDAARFGPKRFKAVREAMVGKGWCRNTVNSQTVRLRRIFKWAAENEMLPITVYQTLQAVPGLKYGRTDAPESGPVRPVPEEHVYAVCEHAPDEIAAMLRLQLLTACRPGEIVLLRPMDLDCRGTVWLYKPELHKNLYRGHKRTIYLGPEAQGVLSPLMADCPTDQYVFSPKRVIQRKAETADTHRRPRQEATPRKTPRKVRDRYDVCSYRRAVTRIVEEHDLQPFTLHQLRHTAATRIRAEFGLEMAQLACGHAHANTTELYAESATQKALQVFAKIG